MVCPRLVSSLASASTVANLLVPQAFELLLQLSIFNPAALANLIVGCVLFGQGLLVVGDFLIQIRQLLVELVLGVNPGFVGIGFEKATVHGHFFAPKQRQLFAQ